MYKEKLLEMGIPADLAGFEYINYAIQVYKPLMKTIPLYKIVAEKFGTTSTAVERNIRHAISKSNDVLMCGRFIAKYAVLWGQKGE